MPGSGRELGLAALSALQLPPDEMVRRAAGAGFDAVGLRVQKVTDAEPVHDLSPGSALQRRVLAALRETGLRVHDAEFLLLDGTGPSETARWSSWLRALDAAAELGARTFTVAGGDPERSRLAATLADLTASARDRGLQILLEPISYQAVRTVGDAAALARQCGCGVLADTLHLARAGTTAEDLDAAADVIEGIQLVDGPARPPEDRDGLVRESRSDRLAPGDGAFPLREYLAHLPQDLPVSVECCSTARTERIGVPAWIDLLGQRARALLPEPHARPGAPSRENRERP